MALPQGQALAALLVAMPITALQAEAEVAASRSGMRIAPEPQRREVASSTFYRPASSLRAFLATAPTGLLNAGGSIWAASLWAVQGRAARLMTLWRHLEVTVASQAQAREEEEPASRPAWRAREALAAVASSA